MTTKTKVKPWLPQNIMMHYYQINEARLELDRKSRELLKEENQVKDVIMAFLHKHAEQEPGKYVAKIEAGGRYPAWKEEFIRLNGQPAADAVIANTPFNEKLVVELR